MRPANRCSRTASCARVAPLRGGEAAVAHAGQEPGLQCPADGRFRVGGDLRAVGKGVQRRGGSGIFAGQGRVAAQDGAQLLARDGRAGLEARRGHAGDDALVIGPADRLRVPAARQHVFKRADAAIGLAREPPEDGHEHGAGHGPVGREGPRGRAGHEAVFQRAAHAVIVPAASRQVGKLRGGRAGLQRAGGHDAGNDAGDGVVGLRLDGRFALDDVGARFVRLEEDGLAVKLRVQDLGLAELDRAAREAAGQRDVDLLAGILHGKFDLQRVGAVDGDRRVKRRLDHTAQHPCAQHGSDRFLLRLFRSRIVKGEGGKNVVLLGVRDLEGLAAQCGFRRPIGAGQRVGNGVAVLVELRIVYSPVLRHGVAEGVAVADGFIHRAAAVAVAVRKVVVGDEPPSAAAVVNVEGIFNEPAVARRIAAGEAVELLHVERVVVLLEYAALRVGIAVAFTRFAELPRDVVFCKGVVPPEHAQTRSALDGDVVAGERAVGQVRHTVAIERHIAIALVRAILPSFPVLTVVFTGSFKVDSGDTEGYRVRVDPAGQCYRNILHAPVWALAYALNLHPELNTVYPPVLDSDLASIGVLVCIRQIGGDRVHVGFCLCVFFLEFFDFFFQCCVDRFD